MISEQYERAKSILSEQSEGHRKLANLLMEREVIFAEDVENIFGKRPWASRSEEIFEKNGAANDDTKTNTNINEHETPQENATESEASEKTTNL